ncbi:MULTISPECIES: M67 family metallopeptidase [Sporomusa]|uniref:M67 family metallopeptidase n=1 Tax=Sporomusa TaxID=2375 RepID=UPI001CB7F3C7|nr:MULTISPECIES: M67 family metallopeptidase [Sporomusa]MCM0760757.1 M67 family metallopeptidase [Sporomusa sphaeroides DSM 2875]HML32267.1 M67 family metallopeptidase [Sporomusa sphaeroides]
MLIILQKQDYKKIVRQALEQLPVEACGLLGGTIDENGNSVVKGIYPLTNMDNSPEHFSMDPKEQFAAVKDMRKQGWSMLGNYHSHPASPARPSAEDKRLAFDPKVSYFIISLLEREQPVLKSFRIQQGLVAEEEIKIIGEE